MWKTAEAGTHFTDPVRMESRVSFGGKEGHTNVQHSAEPGFEPGTLWLEGRDLTTAPTKIFWFKFYPLLIA